MKTNARFALVLSALLTTACAACAPPSVESLPPTSTQTGLQVDIVPGSSRGEFDVFDAEHHRVVEKGSPDSVLVLPAGHYSIERSYTAGYVWAPDVEVVDGAVAHVALGAIRVVPVAGAIDPSFSTWTLDGRRLVEVDAVDTLIAAPAGNFRIADAAAPLCIWQDDLVVTAGEIAEAKLAAIRVTIPSGTADTQVSIFDASKSTRLKEDSVIGPIQSVPASMLTLTRHDNAALSLATIQPVAGTLLEVNLGAIYWNGSVKADLYDASQSVREMEGIEPGTQFAAGAGMHLFTAASTPAVISKATVTSGTVAAPVPVQ